MKRSQWFKQLGWAIALSIFACQSVGAEESSREANLVPAEMPRESVATPAAEIPRIDDLDRPVTSVEEWVAQSEAAIAQITGVQVNAPMQDWRWCWKRQQGRLPCPKLVWWAMP